MICETRAGVIPMTRSLRVSFVRAGLAALAVVACATETPIPAPSVASSEKQEPGPTEFHNVVKVSAVVKSIDQKTRVVTLRRADEVRNPQHFDVAGLLPRAARRAGLESGGAPARSAQAHRRS
jgi:NAD(P)-dependent dehydrogenase (short-subunit alcohol dehydrogenase family)